MDEYDTQHLGFLSQEEFMVLADLILRNYEALVQTSDTKKVCIDFVAMSPLVCLIRAHRLAHAPLIGAVN